MVLVNLQGNKVNELSIDEVLKALKPMFENFVYPYLNRLQPEGIYSKMVKLCGIGESQAETMILDLNFDAKLWGKSQCCIILDKDGLRWM